MGMLDNSIKHRLQRQPSLEIQNLSPRICPNADK